MTVRIAAVELARTKPALELARLGGHLNVGGSGADVPGYGHEKNSFLRLFQVSNEEKVVTLPKILHLRSM